MQEEDGAGPGSVEAAGWGKQPMGNLPTHCFPDKTFSTYVMDRPPMPGAYWFMCVQDYIPFSIISIPLLFHNFLSSSVGHGQYIRSSLTPIYILLYTLFHHKSKLSCP